MKPNRASATARLIAAATVLREADPNVHHRPPRGAAAWCARFLSTNPADRLLLRSMRFWPTRMIWCGVERAALPGIVDHWMLRKREIDRLARQAGAQGFTQLIVLGAGMDSLAFRMAERGEFKAILSADHPATLSVIRTALTNEANVGVHLLAIDLTIDDVASTLTVADGFDANANTLFVIEGVLMYLRETKVRELLNAIHKLPTPRARVIASWMHAEPGREIGFHGQPGLVTRWLRRRAEPMLWGSTPEGIGMMLNELGWHDARLIDLARPEVASLAVPKVAGEWLLVLDR
jgi:methyltransferase (TIGR00027 family)